MAEDKEEKEEKVEKSSGRRYGWTDVRKYAPTEEVRKSIFSRVVFAAVILALILVAVYGYYWATSPGGERSLGNIKNFFSEYNPASWYGRQISTAQERTGNLWTAESNYTKSGIVFKELRFAGSSELPKGAPIVAIYNLDIINTNVDSIEMTASCWTKGKVLGEVITGEILPQNPILVSGKDITQNIRCRINPEDIREITGTMEVKGNVKFPYETKDVSLKVYFASQGIIKQIGDDDFFDYYKIDESSTIRAKYNGEPVEVGLGVSYENEQPVLIGEGSTPLIGISVINRWEGRMANLTSFTITIPRGLEIDEQLSQNPNLLCPFEKSRVGKNENEYRAVESLIEGISLERDKSYTFECWLKPSDTLLGDAAYTVKEYKASIAYNYELMERSAVVTIKA